MTTLLHGNEPSGFRAFRTWLAGGVPPAVDTAFYICSVETALGPPLFTHRALPGARDANRCFLPPFEGPEGHRARRLLDLIERFSPEALIDVHNNTGHSPAYGVGTAVDEFHLGLTALFADRFMHGNLHLGTLVETLHDRVPSVVIECGRAGDPVADATALSGLERFLTLDDLGSARARAPGVEVLRHPIRVLVRGDAVLAFGEAPVPGATLTVRRGLDRHNFQAVSEGEVVGWIAPEAGWPIEADGPDGNDVSRELFACVDGELRTRREMVPVMMTTLPEIAKSDCLFYALERAGSRGNTG